MIGGGFGGAVAAKTLRRIDPGIEVTLVEPKRIYHTCPFSNHVLGGLRDMASIARNYEALVRRYGVRLVRERATAIDADRREVRLSGGARLAYDRLIVSPGIGFRWNDMPGYGPGAVERMPHAWNAGPQTALLRRQIEAMDDGGLVVIVAPDGLYRCEPAPYERASLIAHYLKGAKPRSKILILDAKETFSKQELFLEGWKKYYPGMIEWVPLYEDGKVVRAEPETMTVETEFGQRHRGAVVNLIPRQKAGPIAEQAGLADRSGWCPVDVTTFESTRHAGIHVIGDAALLSPVSKSAFAAIGEGRAVAAAVAALLRGLSPRDPEYGNLCYNLVAPDYGIVIKAAYRVREGRLMRENRGRKDKGLSPAARRRREARLAEPWYRGIVDDAFG